MKISELERIVGVTAGTIRYWEERGLLCADRAENRYRTYTEADIRRIARIKSLREIGVAIADIKLWCDGVIDMQSLLRNHKKQMEADDIENRRLRELCDRMLANPDGAHADAVGGSVLFAESDTAPRGALLLGIDIGTTSVSAQLLSLETGMPLHTYSIDHGAAYPKDAGFGADACAADAEKLLSVALGLVSSAVDAYPGIAAIGFAGQMHGIVCVDSENRPLTPLYTWQNAYGQRTHEGERICQRAERLTGMRTPTGYGLLTYYALKTLGLLPAETDRIATVADLAAAVLCDAPLCCHPTNAASLGYYQPAARRFDTDALQMLDIPAAVLPPLSDDFALAGRYRGIPVSVAIGDNQAGVFGTLCGDTKSALLNIGTSGQISRVVPKNAAPEIKDAAMEIRPYFGDTVLLTGATLSGGRALAMLASLLGEVAEAFGVSPTRQALYDTVNRAADAAESALQIRTTFGGTRAQPDEKGEITGIGATDLTLPALCRGFCRGIVGELYALYCQMDTTAPAALVLSGNALRRNAALRSAAKDMFACPTKLPVYREEAAHGAALYAGICAGLLTAENAQNFIRYETQA